jgi:uncharacterized protein YfaS (alpha-2-macroglobulin family)
MTTQKVYRGDTIGKIWYFYNESNVLIEPSTISIAIVDPNGTTKVTLTKADLTFVATGTYKMKYNVPTDGAYGLWSLQVTATLTTGMLQNTEVFTFSVKSK